MSRRGSQREGSDSKVKGSLGGSGAGAFRADRDIAYYQPEALDVYQTPRGTVAPYQWGGPKQLPWGRSSTVVVEFSACYGACISSDNNASNKPPTIARDWFDNLYGELFSRVQQSGRFILYTPLDNVHAMNDWAGAYMLAYTGVRMLESILAARDYNVATEKMASTVGTYKYRIEAAHNRLEGVPMPKGLPGILDTVSGAFASGPESTIWFAGGGADPTHHTYDPTSSNDVASMLTNIENAIGVVYLGGSSAVTAMDAARLMNLFANLYQPNKFAPAGIRFGDVYLDELETMCIVGNDGSTFVYSVPFPATAGGASDDSLCPIVFRKGTQNPLRFSFYRPQLLTFNFSGTFGSHGSEQAGLCQQANSLTQDATYFRVWDTHGNNGGSWHVNNGNAVLAQITSPQSCFWWAEYVIDLLSGAVAGSTFDDVLASDFRMYRDRVVTGLSNTELAQNTIEISRKLYLNNEVIV